MRVCVPGGSEGPNPRARSGGEASLAAKLIKINLLVIASIIALYLVLNASGVARGAYCALSADGVTLICPLGLIQRFGLTESPPCAIIVGVFILVAAIILFGRFFCGWICPMSAVLRLIGNRGGRAGGNGRLHIPAFSLSLALLLTTSWILGFPVFCIICPIGIVSRLIIFALSGVMDPWAIIWGVAVLTTTILLIKAHRWCNSMCPLGAIQTLLSPIKLMRIKMEHGCRKCGACAKACPLGLEIHKGRKADQMSCTTCLKCVVICPFNALKLALVRPRFHKKI